jgi:hypothetical protein
MDVATKKQSSTVGNTPGIVKHLDLYRFSNNFTIFIYLVTQ